MSPVTPFDPTGPLPRGRVVLEASAGTGKTWSIAALVTRYVAEAGLPIDQLLVVTFTRAATGELRDRVRSRLAEAQQFLTTPGAHPGDDVILGHLDRAPAEQRSLYAERLERALATFDRATITTLHGFASRLLRGLGLLSAAPARLTLAGDHGDLLAEAVSDMVVQRFAAKPGPPLTLAEIGPIATAVLQNLDADIIPAPGEASGAPAVRADFARDLRRELAVRSERAGILTYDDLLLRARDALADPAVGLLARRVVSRRFQVALIDEFQDTDRLQWEIADLLFPPDTTTLVIVGDPKQAIYAFRGADVDAYLAAVSRTDPENHRTLTTNQRSDQPLIAGLDRLFHDVAFGDDRIPYRQVSACADHQQAAISGTGASVQIRQVTRHPSLPVGSRGSLLVAGVRRFIAEDVAAHTVALLSGGGSIHDQPIGPGDIAVLCRTHRHIKAVQAALNKRQVPAVISRSGSVLDTPAAFEWLILLNAVELPSARRVRQAAVSPFVGVPPEDLAQVTDESLDRLHSQIARWGEQLRAGGIPLLTSAIEAETGMASRVLRDAGGERHLTDLYHVAELLHAARRAGGIRSLSAWLEDQIATVKANRGAEEAETRLRRLDTDREAVQLLTIHGVKGLQFPIVLCPFLWDLPSPAMAVPVFHPAPGAARSIDAGGPTGPDFAAHKLQAQKELAGEELRLMYVALTRARHHLVIWWAPADPAKTAPISRALFRDPTAAALQDRIPLQDDAAHTRQLAALAAASSGAIAATAVATVADPTPWEAPPATGPDLAAATFSRPIDRVWTRASFSGLTAGARDRPMPPDAGGAGKDDEPDEADAGQAASPALPFDDQGGLAFGTLVHDVLEKANPAEPDLGARLLDASRAAVARSGLPVEPTELASWLETATRTPLFPGAHAPSLQEMAAAGWLPEMGFELPVAVAATGRMVNPADLADLLEGHQPGDGPLVRYATRLRDLGAPRFRGYLNGFVDLVTCLPGGHPFWVIDYKSNRLPAPPGKPADHAYYPEALAEEMIHEHYFLQALFYQVALHRYLRSRLRGEYDPATHLGGAMYLFLRGMSGPETPESAGGRRGVFCWPAPVRLILAVDELLREGRPA